MTRLIVILSILLLVCGSGLLQADSLRQQPLFKIERNSNANIVQYDAQIGPDGKLDKRRPVVAYWVRLAEQGQIKKLSWIQKMFAYGFKTDYDREADSAILSTVADIGRKIKVLRINGSYAATARIDEQPSRIVKLYIHATGRGLSTKVDFIEFSGVALKDGEPTHECYIP